MGPHGKPLVVPHNDEGGSKGFNHGLDKPTGGVRPISSTTKNTRGEDGGKGG